MGTKFNKDVEPTINMIELLRLLKKAGEDFFELTDFHQFYDSLTDQEKQFLPRYDKLKVILDKIATIPTIMAVKEIAPEEYKIIDPPRQEEYDRYYKKEDKKDVHHQLEQLCEAYTKFLQNRKEESYINAALIEESIASSLPKGNFIYDMQDFFDYLFIAISKQGISSLNKKEFLDYFTPHNPSLLSLKLDICFNRILLHGENAKKIVDKYFEKSKIYSHETEEDYFYIIPNEEKEKTFLVLEQEDSKILNDIIDRYMKKKSMLSTEQEIESMKR